MANFFEPDNEPLDPNAEAADRGSVDKHDPRTDDSDFQAFLAWRNRDVPPETPRERNGDPNLKPARAGEAHATPVQPEWGEGVVTGDPADHYVHLANGAVIPGSSGGTHYHDPEMGLVPIVRTFPAGKTLEK
jgi:hypothetical protein